jgi:hypothetical protein
MRTASKFDVQKNMRHTTWTWLAIGIPHHAGETDKKRPRKKEREEKKKPRTLIVDQRGKVIVRPDGGGGTPRPFESRCERIRPFARATQTGPRVARVHLGRGARTQRTRACGGVERKGGRKGGKKRRRKKKREKKKSSIGS